MISISNRLKITFLILFFFVHILDMKSQGSNHPTEPKSANLKKWEHFQQQFNYGQEILSRFSFMWCKKTPNNEPIFTPQPLRAVRVLFSPMVFGWVGGRAGGGK